jgi:hypothetical protein
MTATRAKELSGLQFINRVRPHVGEKAQSYPTRGLLEGGQTIPYDHIPSYIIEIKREKQIRNRNYNVL